MDTVTVDTLAATLQEPKRPLLAAVLRVLGQARCGAILANTLTCEASGGMLTKDGTRRRTPGGVFFQLVRERATKKSAGVCSPRPQPRAAQGNPTSRRRASSRSHRRVSPQR
jgi:phosphorylated adapter RNA export protein